MLKLSEQLWQSSQSIVERVMQHPFIMGVRSGTLAIEKFHYYLQQDALYLLDYSRALAITASKMHDADDYIRFLQFAQDAVLSERSMQMDYLGRCGEVSDASVTPACFIYRKFLLSTAMLESVLYSVVALLPCFFYMQKWREI